MAFWNRRRSKGLLASAAPLDPNTPRGSDTQLTYQKWQDEAWQMYDDVGEYRQGVTWLGNVLSRARLVAAYAPQNPGDEPTIIDGDSQDPARRLVEQIAHGIGGQAELLRSAAVHLSVPGEGWFVGANPTNVEHAWKFYSAEELELDRSTKTYKVKVASSTWKDLGAEVLPIRCWRPHNRRHWEADSSTRAALPILRRLELLNRRVDAEIQSRLAMNGVYWIASEIDFPAKQGYENADDPFVAEFYDVGKTTLKTPGSAGAALPMVARAASEYIRDGVRLDKFSEPMSADLMAAREFEIRRLATAMDVPPEVLLGMVGVNHWGQWMIEESALKTTVTNLLELVCWSLTVGYLAPAMSVARERNLFDQEMDPNLDRIVWYDLSELTVRPDRSSDVIALHGSLTVNDACLARETGLNADDMIIDDAELERRIGIKLVTAPSTAAAGLEMLGLTPEAEIGLRPDGQPIEPAVPVGNEGDLPANDDVRSTPEAGPSSNGDSPPAVTVVSG